MRAASGAIEAIHIEDDVAFKVIGGSQPIGMCGSGLIDLVAELLRLGVIVWTGDLLGPDTAPPGLPAAILRYRTSSRALANYIKEDFSDGAGSYIRPLALTRGSALRAGAHWLFEVARLQFP